MTGSSFFSRTIQYLLSFDLHSNKTKTFSTNQRAKLALRTFLLYIFYLVNIVLVAILSQSSNHYWMTHTFESRWIQKEFSLNKRDMNDISQKYPQAFRIRFDQISTFEQIWSFVEQVLGPTVYSNRTSSSSISFLFEHYLLMGVLRMRQVRVQSRSCSIPSFYTDEIDQCYPSYSSNTKQTSPFGPMDSNGNVRRAWIYMTDDETGMDRTTGNYGDYDASGYLIDFSSYDRRWKHFRDEIDDLKRYRWLDQGTRAVFIDLMLYNPSVNVFSSIQFIFEMPFTGGIFPSYRISHRQLFRTKDSASSYIRLICEVFIVFFTIFFILMEFVKIVGLRFQYFFYLWNWIDLLHLTISISLIVVFIYRSYLFANRSIEDFSASRTTFDRFTYRLFRLQTRYDHLSLILVSISIIRTLKYCDFASNLIRIKATIQRCSGDLVGFLIMFVALMIAFAQFGNLTLGQQAPAFSTVGKAFVALFRTVLGDFDYDAIRRASPIIGPIFFFLYIFTMVFMLFNMVLAIIVDSYEELGNEYRHVVHQMLINVIPSIKDAIRLFFERLHLWNKMKILLRSESSSNQKTVSDLLQTLKYSSQTSSLYDELRQAFAHDLDRLIDEKEFQRYLKFAENDQERQRDSLQQLFTHITIPHETTRELCTIQQWSNFKYRLARLEEVGRLIEAKLIYIVEHLDIDTRRHSHVFVDERHLALASSEDD